MFNFTAKLVLLSVLALGFRGETALTAEKKESARKNSYECACEGSDKIAWVKAESYDAAKDLADRYCKRAMKNSKAEAAHCDLSEE